jgi:ubiquinone/menaquinone biosynthesis C-methylase UbiE/spore maturation protein CgeB
MSADRINELYAGDIFDLETQKTAKERIHWICAQAQGDKILDIGCSQGMVCLLLGREGFNCIGVDHEENAIDYALKELQKEEEAVQKRVRFQHTEASQLPFEDDFFDTVILGEVLEHLTHPEKVLKEASRVLTPGGRAVITVPFGLHPAPDHKRTYYPRSFLEDVHPFFRTASIDLLRNYIIYTGTKDPSYDVSKVSGKVLALEKLALQQEFEERFLANELALRERSKQFHDQSRAMNQDFRTQLKAKDQELRKTLAAKDEELKNKLISKDQELRKTLAAKDEELKNKLISKDQELRNEFKQSWTWRLGALFVFPCTLLLDFIRNPFQFSKEFSRRFKTLYSHFYKSGPGSRMKKQINQIASPSPSGMKGVIHDLSSPLDVVRINQNQGLDARADKILLGCIMDEFTAACFRPECKMITFRPDNWKETLEYYAPKALFVESAWRGNNGSWQYRIAKYQKNMGDELLHLLDWAKDKKIPSVFWNKEDPVHFDRFIEKAGFFDHVFTSDANCISRYREHLNHGNIYALPFAAQPAIHNPILDHPRDKSVCFAGAYYGDRHEERRSDMEHILKPSLSWGLEIYDRQYGLTGKQAELYRFPDIYQSAIKGRLEYDEMVKAYKQYRVFLNVNSVKDSPTMFSRRVYELLACGTPVISTYSKGILELLGEDIVFISESEEDTKKHLVHLLGDNDAWMKASVRGIRRVMEEHTYAVRLKEILDRLGINSPESPLLSFTVLAKISTEDEIDRLADTLKGQTHRQLDLIVLSEQPLEKRSLQRLRNGIPDIPTVNIHLQSKDPYAQVLDTSRSDYFAVLDMRDHYGPHYLKDFALAIMYSNVELLGKHSYYAAYPETVKIENLNRGYEFMFVNSVPSAAFVFKKDALATNSFLRCFKSRVFKSDDQQILSIDPFNYLQNTSDSPLEGFIEENNFRSHIDV